MIALSKNTGSPLDEKLVMEVRGTCGNIMHCYYYYISFSLSILDLYGRHDGSDNEDSLG